MPNKVIPDPNRTMTNQSQVTIVCVPDADNIALPPVSATRKRGKCMSRRAGQNPSVRTRLNRTKEVEEYFFQYWTDVPGQEERRRETEVIGPVNTITKSEAQRNNLEFILNLTVKSNNYRI